MSSTTSAPTRVGFIGLSKISWAAFAHAPYFLSTDKYKIVALCNTSVESAAQAVKDFSLPSDTATYGDPNDLAKDPNVDLVIDSVRVDRHFPTVSPSLLAGKSVFVEFPLGKDLAEAEELLRLSKAYNVKHAFVGTQEVASPIVKKLRELISSGRIGKLLSSSVIAQVVTYDVTKVPELHTYVLDAKIGSNMVTIIVGHLLASIQSAFGETIDISSSLLANKFPSVTIAKMDGTTAAATKDTHDHVMFLAQTTKTKAPVSFVLRQGPAFKGTPGFEWRIYGEKGEIKITAPHGMLADGLFGGETITIHDFGKDELVEVELAEEYENLPVRARNLARTYEAIHSKDFANLLTFEQAVQIHTLLDKLLVANPL